MKVNRIVRSVKTKLSKNIYNWLFVSVSTPGILYGPPQINKISCPIRLILLALGTPIITLLNSLFPSWRLLLAMITQ